MQGIILREGERGKPARKIGFIIVLQSLILFFLCVLLSCISYYLSYQAAVSYTNQREKHLDILEEKVLYLESHIRRNSSYSVPLPEATYETTDILELEERLSSLTVRYQSLSTSFTELQANVTEELQKLREDSRRENPTSSPTDGEQINAVLQDFEVLKSELNSSLNSLRSQFPRKLATSKILPITGIIHLDNLFRQRSIVPTGIDLLYRASENDYSAAVFHTMCDGKGPTLTVVKAKGQVFGGYTEGNWSSYSPGRYVEGSLNDFMFTLDGVLPVYVDGKWSRHTNAIRANKATGPQFGVNPELKLDDKCNVYESSISYLGGDDMTYDWTSVKDRGSAFHRTDGVANEVRENAAFICEEYEVYAVRT